MLPSTNVYSRDLESLLNSLPEIKPIESDLIAAAYQRAEAAHSGQKRKSGEPYFTHCVAVASILAEMKMDAETIAAGLLHDVAEDSEITVEALRGEFGGAIAKLVDGVTKLKNLPIKNVSPAGDTRRSSAVNREMEYIRKIMLTMGDDVRVVLVKLADRLHNMRTLGYMPRHKQRAVAQETMDIFAPLANRLGIWQMKWELEDLSFRYLNPEAYRSIAKALDERRDERESYVSRIRDRLIGELNASRIMNVTITARPKHIYSIYNKMTKKDLPLEQIYDVRGMRVLVESLEECYLALGIAHNLWRPIPGEFDDYIANPKDNFYRSLHTAVHDDEGKTVEIQIRTWEMHEDAEYGIAAHWRYKEGGNGHDQAFEQRLAFLRRLMEFGPEVNDASQFVDTVKSEVFQDRVYSVTPNGDIIDLAGRRDADRLRLSYPHRYRQSLPRRQSQRSPGAAELQTENGRPGRNPDRQARRTQHGLAESRSRLRRHQPRPHQDTAMAAQAESRQAHRHGSRSAGARAQAPRRAGESHLRFGRAPAEFRQAG